MLGASLALTVALSARHTMAHRDTSRATKQTALGFALRATEGWRGIVRSAYHKKDAVSVLVICCDVVTTSEGMVVYILCM